MAETYLAMGDKENAIAFYEETLREVRRVATVSDAEREEVSRLEQVIRGEIEAIRQGKPRL